VTSTKATLLILGMALGMAMTVVPAVADEPSVDVTVVYGATRSDAKATDVAATVNSIGVEEIERLPVRNVADLLRTVPGVHLVQQGSRGGAAGLFIRGANSNQTLVVVDGVRINNPMTGGVDLGNLTLDQVQRIEVVKGPFTTLYGSDAVGGVVYVFTKSGAQVEDRAKIGAGGFGTYTASAVVGDGQGDRGWTLSGSWIDTDGTRDINSDYSGFTAAGRFDTPLAGGVLTLSGRYQSYERGVPGSTFFPSPTDRQDYSTILGSLHWKREGMSSRDTVRLGMWQEDYTLDYLDFLATPQISQADPTCLEANWQHDFLLGNGEVNLGLDWRRFEGDYRDTATGTYNEENDSKAVYAQVQLRPGRNWRLLGGARLQDDDLFDTDPTWRFGATRLLDGGRAGLWAGWGTAFKAPTFNDLFFPGSGNTGLRPETSEGWEIGAWDSLGDVGQAEIVFFRHDFEDLIQWAPGPGGFWFPYNIGTARTHGVELSLSGRLNDNLDHRLAVSTLNWSTNGDPLLRRPDLQFSYGLNYSGESTRVHLDSYFVGKRQDIFGFATLPADPYFVVNLGAEYALDDATGLWMNVENLFDYDYEAAGGYPSPGFTVVAGVSREL